MKYLPTLDRIRNWVENKFVRFARHVSSGLFRVSLMNNNARITLHLDCLRGINAHHQCETVFKAFARALRSALEVDPRMAGVMPVSAMSAAMFDP